MKSYLDLVQLAKASAKQKETTRQAWQRALDGAATTLEHELRRDYFKPGQDRFVTVDTVKEAGRRRDCNVKVVLELDRDKQAPVNVAIALEVGDGGGVGASLDGQTFALPGQMTGFAEALSTAFEKQIVLVFGTP